MAEIPNSHYGILPWDGALNHLHSVQVKTYMKLQTRSLDRAFPFILFLYIVSFYTEHQYNTPHSIVINDYIPCMQVEKVTK
jgi:hypothetical protein